MKRDNQRTEPHRNEPGALMPSLLKKGCASARVHRLKSIQNSVRGAHASCHKSGSDYARWYGWAEVHKPLVKDPGMDWLGHVACHGRHGACDKLWAAHDA